MSDQMTLTNIESTKRNVPMIITIGGGKGGIGKSFLSAALGRALAERGDRVLLVDFDFGGSNLHAWLGVQPPVHHSIGKFVAKRGAQLSDYIQELPTENLAFLGGTMHNLPAPNMSHGTKKRLFQQLHKLPYDRILVDLGAGRSFHTLDAFLLGTLGVLVVTPEKISIENAYQFLRAVQFRWLRQRIDDAHCRKCLSAYEKDSSRAVHFDEIIADIASERPELEMAMRAALMERSTQFVLNQVWEAEELKVATQIGLAVERHLGIPLGFLGPVRYEELVSRSIRRIPTPMDEIFRHDSVREDILGVVERIVKQEDYRGATQAVGGVL